MDPGSHLPLKNDVFQLLLLLLDDEKHGYALMRDIEEQTGGDVKMLPGALYRHLQRMLDDGLIEERGRRKARDSGDQRRRYYRITRFGRRVAEAEATRLAKIVRMARSKNLVRDPA